MKKIIFLFVWLLCIPAMLFAESGVYVGGHIRRERPSTIEKLKKSGFSYVILFNINVESDGTLTCDGETVCKDGVYVFGNTQPEYVSDITSLKQWPTNIRRIDICIGGWGNESYSRIQSLVNSQGTGSGSILYRNFKALKDALPVIDGVNNDDEHCYDVASAASFHIMMSDLGYKTSLAPYMNKSYWENLATRINSARPGACDRVMVQCYDGGAGNNPCDWHINGLPLYAGRTNYQSSMEESISQMQSWKDNCGVSGGFVWVYNDETWDLNDWATRMNRIFGSYQTAQNSVVTVYSDMNYGGYAVGLPLGEHDMAALAAYGIINDDISSLKVPAGYKVTLYDNSGFGGDSRTYTSDASYVGDDFNDRCTSIKVSTAGVSGKGGLYKLQNRNSGLYMDVNNNSTENNANVLVFADEQGDPSQFWQLTEVGEGIYSIKNYRSGKVLDIMDNSTDNGAVVQQYDDYSAANQQFILLDAADGYYYLAASHCGKVVEVPSSSLEWGEWCKLYDNNGSATQQWKLVDYKPQGYAVATVYKDADYKGSSLGLPEGSYNAADLALYGIGADQISSLKVTPGYRVILYDGDNFDGENVSYTGDTNHFPSFNDKTSSIRVEASGVSGKSGVYKLKNRNSGLYMDVENNSTANNANVVVFSDEGSDLSQHWTLTEAGNGVYSIANYRSGLVMDVVDAGTDDGTVIQQYEDYSSTNQQFILVDAGGGYYHLVARHCGKALEIPDSSTDVGEWVKLYSNNGTNTQQWRLVSPSTVSDDEAAVATVYQDADFEGTSMDLPEGEYTTEVLELYGLGGGMISSLEVMEGYKVTLYKEDNFGGESISYTSDTNTFGSSWNDKTYSLKVEASGVSGLSGTYKIQNRNSGLYMDVEDNSTANNAAIVQYSNEPSDPTQTFSLAEVGNGVYVITNSNSGKVLDVSDSGTENSTVVQQYDYYEGHANQQFILVDASDGYYSLVARHCGKVVEVPESKTDLGEWLKIWTNNGSDTQQWLLVTDLTGGGSSEEEPSEPADDVPENPSSGDITPWITSGDRSRLLAQMDGLQFGETYSTTSTITVNSSETYQEIDGFGFTLTEGSAEVIMSLTSEKQEELLQDLFNPETGIGVSVIRLGIGATDLSSYVYSYNDNDGDTDMSEFSLEGPDTQYTIPVLLKALAINPDIKVMATPWSAPEWMKFDNNYLNNDYYSAYALYFVKYLQAMQAYGIDIWAVTPQNEPLNTTNNPSMGMTQEDQYTFVNNYLGPQLETAGFGDVKIICYDHNCDNTEFPIYVSQSSYVDGSAFHLYAGDISAMTDVYHRTGKGVYFTEQYTGVGGDFQGDFSWHLRNVLIGAPNNYSKTVLEWNLANNSSMGPHTEGGCDTCLGAITVENSTSYTKNVAYYIIAQASKFVKPGAVRLGCSSTSLPATAFKNTDGSYVVICHNENTDYTHTTTITIDGQSFSYEIPAGSAATFVWGVSDSGDDGQGGEDEEETPSGTYDYWVVCRDELPDGVVLDLRACPLYVWENTLVGTTVQDAAEGSDAIAFTISASTGSWFGGGYNTGSIEVGLSQIADYNLYFSYKTDYSGQLQVKISGTNGEFAVGFDHTPDLQWHSTYIPMSEFVSAGLQLGTMDNWLAFGIVGENTISTGNYLSLDNIYYAKSRIPGDTGEENLPTSVDLDDTGSGIYLWPNPADDYVYVENVEAGETIKVVDLSGRVVLSSVADGSVLDVAGLQQGTYLLVVSGKALKFMVK